MKSLRITALTVLSISPSLATALTLEELTAELTEDQATVLIQVEPTARPIVLELFSYILEIEDDTQRSRAIRRAVNFIESPEVLSVEQLMHRLDGYGVVLPAHDVDRLYAFAQEMELRFALKILETGASIEEIETQIARIRSSNAMRLERIRFLRSEVERIEAEGAAEVERIEAEGAAEVERIRAEVERIRAEVELLNAAIARGQRVIEDLEARR